MSDRASVIVNAYATDYQDQVAVCNTGTTVPVLPVTKFAVQDLTSYIDVPSTYISSLHNDYLRLAELPQTSYREQAAIMVAFAFFSCCICYYALELNQAIEI